ncbi:MAG: M23 family metallopeptidase, partial [Nocardioides sp.]
SGVTDRLVAARERDAELRQQLLEAEAALTAANDALVEGREDVRHQQATVRNSVLSIFTQGDPRLRAVGALLSNASLEDLTRRQVADDLIVGRGVQAYEYLSDVKERLAEKQDRVKAAAEAVEAKKLEAAAHLETMRGVYDDTRAAKLQVDRRVDSAQSAQQRAIRAKVRDREILRKLKQREAVIRQRLIRLAELARARARQRGTGFTGASDGYLAYPARGPVTSPYGYRTHPIYGYYSLHNGTDFGVGCGQALYASATGTVINTYYDAVYGNRLFLNVGVVNGNSLVLVYNHLSGYSVREGQRVGRGDVVGYGGTTGWSTGCHLHFTVLQNGTPVDPMKYL